MSLYLKTLNGTALYPIGFGTTGTGTLASATKSRDEKTTKILRHAIDIGVNCFDTAEIYGGGYAETLLGRVINFHREALYIITKFNPDNATPTRLRKSLERSLKRLDCDYLDQYQMHWPNPFIPFEDTWYELEQLINEGKIRSVGVGNCSIEELNTYWQISHGRIASVEMCLNAGAAGTADALISWCQEHGVTIFAYSPLGQGKLISTFGSSNKFEIITNICSRYQCSVQALLLAWVISVRGCVPVMRTASIRHLNENIKAVELKLSDEDHKHIATIFQRNSRQIPLATIKVSPIDGRRVYLSDDEALKNRFDWIPSPNILAERIRLGNIPTPLELKRNSNGQVVLDTYDFQGEMKKYWAIRLVYGKNTEVSAFINEETS